MYLCIKLLHFIIFLAKIRVLTRKSCQFWQEKASQSERGI